MTKKRYAIELERVNCIGAAACAAVDPENWKIVSDGLVNLIGGKKKEDNQLQVKDISEEEVKRFMEAAESCPVNAIHIVDKDTGKRLV